MKKAPFQQFQLKKIPVPGKFIMSPVELHEYIDFEVKRIYFITKPEGNTGAHCHKVEEELFILCAGTATAVIDRGNGIEKIPLTAPQDALYVQNYVWHQFVDLSDDAVLLALSSTNYNPNREDYIEDYEEYLKVRDEKLVNNN